VIQEPALLPSTSGAAHTGKISLTPPPMALEKSDGTTFKISSHHLFLLFVSVLFSFSSHPIEKSTSKVFEVLSVLIRHHPPFSTKTNLKNSPISMVTYQMKAKPALHIQTAMQQDVERTSP
jgi:hypothetical protein